MSLSALPTGAIIYSAKKGLSHQATAPFLYTVTRALVPESLSHPPLKRMGLSHY